MMLDELQQRNQSEIYHTQVAAERDRLRQLFRQVSGQARTQELRAGQAYLPKESKLTHGTVVSCLFALRFFFCQTLKRHQCRELPSPAYNCRKSSSLVARCPSSLGLYSWASLSPHPKLTAERHAINRRVELVRKWAEHEELVRTGWKGIKRTITRKVNQNSQGGTA